MKRRSRDDSLAPVNEPTWLVERNFSGALLKAEALDPNADLRAILTTARDAKRLEGWEVDDIPKLCSFFFCTKNGAKVQVGIERRDPADPTYSNSTSSWLHDDG